MSIKPVKHDSQANLSKYHKTSLKNSKKLERITHRPGRVRALSSDCGKLVAAIKMTPSCAQSNTRKSSWYCKYNAIVSLQKFIDTYVTHRLLESIELYQKLIEGLFDVMLILTRPFCSQGIQFIDKNNRRSRFTCCCEQFSDTPRTNPNIHFVEFGT